MLNSGLSENGSTTTRTSAGVIVDAVVRGHMEHFMANQREPAVPGRLLANRAATTTPFAIAIDRRCQAAAESFFDWRRCPPPAHAWRCSPRRCRWRRSSTRGVACRDGPENKAASSWRRRPRQCRRGTTTSPTSRGRNGTNRTRGRGTDGHRLGSAREFHESRGALACWGRPLPEVRRPVRG